MSGAVESFRQITWLIFKWLLIAFSGLIVLVAVFWVGVLGYGWYTHDRHVKNVAFIISTERKDCEDDKFPIHLIVGNASEQTIEKVTFRFEARYPGRSSDLTRFHSYSDDHIIEPKAGWGACWAVPDLSEKVDDPRKLEWSVGSKSIIFR